MNNSTAVKLIEIAGILDFGLGRPLSHALVLYFGFAIPQRKCG